MSIKNRLVYIFWEKLFLSRFINFCRSNNVVVINQHYIGDSAFTLRRLVDRLPLRIKLIYSFHGTDVNSHRNIDNDTKEIWNNLFDDSVELVACSQDLGQRIQDVFGVNYSPHTIYNGIDLEEFTSNAHKKSGSGRMLLSVGKFDEVKGQDVLVRAFASICHLYPDVTLCFVGAKASALTELVNLCSELKISDRVAFHQDIPHNQIPRYFNDAYLFVLPSRREAFPIVILEAGSFGLPVISSNVGGVPEIIKDGVTGKLTPPDDSISLAHEISRLLDDKDYAIQLGENLRMLVKSQYTWKRAVNEYIKLIGDHYNTNILD